VCVYTRRQTSKTVVLYEITEVRRSMEIKLTMTFRLQCKTNAIALIKHNNIIIYNTPKPMSKTTEYYYAIIYTLYIIQKLLNHNKLSIIHIRSVYVILAGFCYNNFILIHYNIYILICIV